MSPLLAFVLGFFSVPVLTLLAVTTTVMFSRSPVLARESGCPHCAQLGWSAHLPNGTHRRRITQAFWGEWHYQVTSRRLPHRERWQSYHESQPCWVAHAAYWKRFGLGRPDGETHD